MEVSESHSGPIWEVGMKFYLSENFSIRTDLTAIHFKAKNAAGSEEKYRSNYDLTASLGYTF